MNRYHLRIIPTHTAVIEADGVDVNTRGDYQFWKFDNTTTRTYNVAHYPIHHTIIEKIEYDIEQG